MREVKLYYNNGAGPGDFEWAAEVRLYEGDETGVRGWGDTPDEAFADLREELDDL